MDHVDETRWRNLVAAERNARDASPSFTLLQEAQGRWSRARSDLEIFRSRGAIGQASARHSPDDIAKAFERGVRELEARVAAAEAEMRRVESHANECADRRAALHALVEGVRAWAKAQNPPIALPGDDDVRVPGFGAAPGIANREPAVASGGAEPLPASAWRQGGGDVAAVEPPATRVHRGSGGLARMMQRWAP
jgi:hypothetical protein